MAEEGYSLPYVSVNTASIIVLGPRSLWYLEMLALDICEEEVVFNVFIEW